MNGYSIASGDYTLLRSLRSGSVMHFFWKYGGFWDAHDQILDMSIDELSGQILSLGTKWKMASWSFPNGFHSGPFKDEYSAFETNILRPGKKNCVEDLSLDPPSTDEDP